ncbi:hypothetical protein LL254_10340 [Marinobacter nauticus]|nr:hypothetical protein [Marinobacter nauticus]MCC4271110.1 hypothetical protein [Marinobacter nauticus]
MSDSSWEAGARRTTKDGCLLALSPEPVMTGERAVDVNTWIRRKTDGWLDLQHGNLLFGAEFSLMFFSLSLLSIGFLGFGLMFAVGRDHLGNWDWEAPLFVLVGNLLISLPWGLYMHFLGNKAVKETPPVRVNRQRREVAIARLTGGEVYKPLFWSINTGLIAYIVVILTIGFLFSAVTQENASDEYRSMLVTWGLSILGVEILLIGTYLFFALRLKKKHDPKLVYEIYPWEKLVAYIETRQDIGPSLMATHTVLTLAIPKPDDPESALAAASINVGHETAGLAQWECIRQFMENGPEACPDPKEDETLAHY